MSNFTIYWHTEGVDNCSFRSLIQAEDENKALQIFFLTRPGYFNTLVRDILIDGLIKH